MPTSREWLEHTERAAWDTVQSLRKQIEEERERVRRLTPIRESWQRILEILDSAKAEHGYAAEGYADVLEMLRDELRQVKGERDLLTQKLTDQERSARDAAHPVQIVRMEPREEARPSEAPWESGWFADRIDAVRHEQTREGTSVKKASYGSLLSAIELKLEELEEATGQDAVELAVELGALALRIAEQQRPRRSSESSEQSDEDDL